MIDYYELRYRPLRMRGHGTNGFINVELCVISCSTSSNVVVEGVGHQKNSKFQCFMTLSPVDAVVIGEMLAAVGRRFPTRLDDRRR